jgi:hypothetical protein
MSEIAVLLEIKQDFISDTKTNRQQYQNFLIDNMKQLNNLDLYVKLHGREDLITSLCDRIKFVRRTFGFRKSKQETNTQQCLTRRLLTLLEANPGFSSIHNVLDC